MADELRKWANQAAKAGERLRYLASLDEYPSWDDLDWESDRQRDHRPERRARPYSLPSDHLAALTAELSHVTGSIKARDQEVEGPGARTGWRSSGIRSAAREAVQVADSVLIRSVGADYEPCLDGVGGHCRGDIKRRGPECASLVPSNSRREKCLSANQPGRHNAKTA